jgi:hypothetical protein
MDFFIKMRMNVSLGGGIELRCGAGTGMVCGLEVRLTKKFESAGNFALPRVFHTGAFSTALRLTITMKTLSKSALVVLAAVAFGCSESPKPPQNPPSQIQTNSEKVVLNETRVLAIARAFVATNDTWVEQSEFETPKLETNGSWSVLVWRIPKVPGGHRFITIDKEGKVVDYIRGH